jgi:hypothetical protein
VWNSVLIPSQINIFEPPIMVFTDEQVLEKYQNYLQEKEYHGIIFPILPEKRNLLGHIDYIPNERMQGNIGNCWVWAGTAALEAENDIQNGVKQRLSIQFFDSNYKYGLPCCWAGDGGESTLFAEFYNDTKYAIPWSNRNGDFQDDLHRKFCNSFHQAWVNPADIETDPRIGIDKITVEKIRTVDVNQATAIRNIKTAINNNHPVLLSISFPSAKALSGFRDFWYKKSESESINVNDFEGLGGSSDGSPSHALLCVGYDGDDWIILNSWNLGKLTGDGPDGKPMTINVDRPNNLFRMNMFLDYSRQWPKYGQAGADAPYAIEYLTEWEVLNVTFAEKPPLRPSLALDRTGTPHIAYITQSGDLKYMSPTGKRDFALTRWSGTVVTNADKGSKYSSLAFDTTGNPSISYADEKTGELKVASFKVAKGGNFWTTETVVKTVDGVGQNSLVITPSGPQISYYDYSTRSLNYASKKGNTWYTTVVDKNSDVGGWNSLQINQKGIPRISYTDYSRAALRYAESSGSNGISNRWSITKVEGGDVVGGIWLPSNYVGKYTSLALDNRGNPWISYYDEGNHSLKYANRIDSLWTTRQVYPTSEAPTGRGIGSYSSLALKKGKDPYISSYDDEHGDLFFAVPFDINQHAKVDTNGDVGRYTSMVLTPNNDPYIAYYDTTSQAVKFAWRPKSTWSVTTVGK